MRAALNISAEKSIDNDREEIAGYKSDLRIVYFSKEVSLGIWGDFFALGATMGWNRNCIVGYDPAACPIEENCKYWSFTLHRCCYKERIKRERQRACSDANIRRIGSKLTGDEPDTDQIGTDMALFNRNKKGRA